MSALPALNPALRTVSEYVGRYDGEIAAADAAVGRLLDALRGRGWYDDATIVLVADHGESLGEEGLWFRTATRWAMRRRTCR